MAETPESAETPETPPRTLLTWTNLNLALPLAFGVVSALFAGLIRLCDLTTDARSVFVLFELSTTLVLLPTILVLNFRVCKPQARGNPILYLVLALGSTLIGGAIVFTGCGLSLGACS
jgi:hypothetical protein